MSTDARRGSGPRLHRRKEKPPGSRDTETFGPSFVSTKM